mmetsp:Transcript_4086/g.7902  ORF Transcript_4086/g.7902 Transcript_4086/m.7902 type:complete len:159 (+) Transcript_4086:711-1187(+)
MSGALDSKPEAHGVLGKLLRLATFFPATEANHNFGHTQPVPSLPSSICSLSARKSSDWRAFETDWARAETARASSVSNIGGSGTLHTLASACESLFSINTSPSRYTLRRGLRTPTPACACSQDAVDPIPNKEVQLLELHTVCIHACQVGPSTEDAEAI